MATLGPVPDAPAAPGEPGPGAAPRRGLSRLRRWALVACLVALACLSAAALALYVLIGQLNHPWVKGQLLELSRERLGLPLDYDQLELSLRRGVRARSLRLLQPPALVAGGPEFVRLEELELRAPLYAFLFGARRVERLSIGRVTVSVVRAPDGATSVSELFPPAPEPAPEARLSQTLVTLPELSIDELSIGAIEGRLIELGGSAPRRSTLGPLAARGALQLRPGDVRGTELTLSGAPLRLELEGGARHASLRVELALRAPAADTLVASASAVLEEQRLVAVWPGPEELLELAATLRFDAAAGKTEVALEPLRVWGEALAVEGRAELFDGDARRVAAAGTAKLALDAPPVALGGLDFAALGLDLTVKELGWDGERLAGAFALEGRARGVELRSGEGFALVPEVTLRGRGDFTGPAGSFEAALGAPALRARAAAATAELDGLRLAWTGSTRDAGGAQQVEAAAELELAGARAAEAGERVALGATRLVAAARGSARELGAGRVPALDGRLELGALELRGAGGGVRLPGASATGSVQGLAEEPASELGWRGEATYSLALPGLELFEVGRRRPAVSVADVSLAGALPLSLATARGTLSVGVVDAGERRLEAALLELDARSPLAWRPGASGSAEVTVSGRVGGLSLGQARGALEGLRLGLSRPEPGRYGAALEVTGSRLAVGRHPLPEQIVARLRADAEPRLGTLTASSQLRGPGGAELDIDLDARFESEQRRLVYSAALSAAKLHALASFVSGAVPRAAGVRLDEMRLSASARGDLSGVLRDGGEGLPTPADHPLRQARGAQSLELELQGLDHRVPGLALRVPKLSLSLESNHRAEAGGDARASLELESLRLEGEGLSVRVEGLSQRHSATFERAPDQGVIDLRSEVSLRSAVQSLWPAYPVRDLELSSHVEIDRLRAIFLRALELSNPASGSSLSAAGTLELLTSSGAGAGNTIVGREALLLEGRLEQALAPLERLDLAARGRGRLAVPFRLESGGLLGYRLLAALEAKDVSFVTRDESLSIEDLNGTIPIVEEFALLDTGPVLSAGPRTSPLSEARFFDVHPFLSGNNYVTARSLQLAGMAPIGPIAGNVRVDWTDFSIDQLQAGYSGGQIVGQVRAAYRDGDPILRLRLNATGLRSGKERDVFDANAALTFVPAALTLDGKVQVVRASRAHVEDILDLLDPYRESANANRVRRALTLGYPKFVRFQLHDGAVDAKVELGGLAQVVRIDEIRAVPLGPILQKYVAPVIAPYVRPRIDTGPEPASAEPAATGGAAVAAPARGGAASAPRGHP